MRAPPRAVATSAQHTARCAPRTRIQPLSASSNLHDSCTMAERIGAQKVGQALFHRFERRAVHVKGRFGWALPMAVDLAVVAQQAVEFVVDEIGVALRIDI